MVQAGLMKLNISCYFGTSNTSDIVAFLVPSLIVILVALGLKGMLNERNSNGSENLFS